MQYAIRWGLAVAAGVVASAPAEAQQLRYNFQPGTGYVYSVRIETEDDDTVETHQGTVTYSARPEGDGLVLSCGGSLVPSTRPKPGRAAFPGPPRIPAFARLGFPQGFLGRHEVKIDRFGQVLRTVGTNALPHALGDTSRLVLEPLSPQGRSSWEAASDCAVVVQSFQRLSPFSSFGRAEKSTLPARERAVYTLEGGAPDAVRIRKQYELRTQETVGGGLPRISITGSGTLTFDSQAGVPKALEFKGLMVENTETTSTRTPITLTYQLQSATASPAAPVPGAPDFQRAPVPSPAATPPPGVTARPPTRDSGALLADLTSPDQHRRRLAAALLPQTPPDGNRDRIARALRSALQEPDGFLRGAAVRALGTWGTRESVPPLIEMLRDSSFSIRWAAMESLGKLKDRRAAEPLVEFVVRGQDRHQASRALQELGPTAEPAVRRLLDAQEPNVRAEACRILKTIGTRHSLPALQPLQADPDGLVRLAAQDAVRTISAR